MTPETRQQRKNRIHAKIGYTESPYESVLKSPSDNLNVYTMAKA